MNPLEQEADVRNRPTITLPEHVRADIRRVVAEAGDVDETGVSLFGVVIGGRRVVLAAVGPGPRATHTPVFYQPDVDYVNAAFDALKSALPSICWIGEFHVHPSGMAWLSGHDRKTMQRLLADKELQLVDFVAGILQRHGSDIAIHPYWFSRSVPEGQAATVEVVESSADVVREARMRAAEDRADKPGSDQREEREADAPVRQRWLGKVVSLLRRKNT